MIEFIKSFKRALRMGGKYWTNYIGLDEYESMRLSLSYVIKYKIDDLSILINALECILHDLDHDYSRYCNIGHYNTSMKEEIVEGLMDSVSDIDSDYTKVLDVLLAKYNRPYTETKIAILLNSISTRIEQMRFISNV